MRRILMIVPALLTIWCSFAQTKKKSFNLANRAADHFVIQLSSDRLLGLPDSISNYAKGLSRGLNVYAMIDKPFKSNPKLSIALGVGIGSSSIYFKRMFVDIASTSPTLPFVNQDTTAYYKKFKLSTSFLEIPLEFRYSSNPENPNKSTKIAIGIKGGTMLNAHTKAKELKNASGATVNGAIWKQNSKSYFNTTRIAATARVGYGIFSLFGTYTLTPMFKDGVAAPDAKTLQIGLQISGL